MRAQRVSGLAAALVLALVLGACGEPASPSASSLATPRPSPVASPHRTAATTPPSGPAGPSPSPSPPAVVPCLPPATRGITAAAAAARLAEGSPVPLPVAGADEAPPESPVRGGVVTDLAWTGERFVAVGSAYATGGKVGVAWTSPDGVRWEEHRPQAAGRPAGALEAIVVGGPGLVAVGVDGAWVSADGDAWTPASAQPGGGARLAAVACSPERMVATGPGAAWTSIDGLAWTAVPAQPALAGLDDIPVLTWSGTAFTGIGNGADAGYGLTSPDGLAWTRGPAQPTLRANRAFQADLAAVGGTLVAVGSADGRAAAWRSPDGLRWTRVQGPGEDGGLDAVTAIGSGLVASLGGDVGRPGLLVSASGRRWAARTIEAARCDDGCTMGPVVVGGDRIVVVGTSYDFIDGVQRPWAVSVPAGS